jgi:hypothetical protein
LTRKAGEPGDPKEIAARTRHHDLGSMCGPLAGLDIGSKRVHVADWYFLHPFIVEMQLVRRRAIDVAFVSTDRAAKMVLL